MNQSVEYKRGVLAMLDVIEAALEGMDYWQVYRDAILDEAARQQVFTGDLTFLLKEKK